MGDLTREQLTVAAGWMNKLPFVLWDRFIGVDHDGIVDRFITYGWIARDDDHEDFVTINADADALAGVGYPEYWTSSARWSAEIGRLLYDLESADGHVPCARVDEHFGDLVANKVVLA